MTACVYRISSALELPVRDVKAFLEDYEFPGGVKDVNVKRRNNTLLLAAVPGSMEVPKYTPAAQLKASVREKQYYRDGDEWIDRPPHTQGDGGARWSQQEAVEEEPVETKTMEVACFRGDRDNVLQNTALQYQMFLVLKDIAARADGTLTAVYGVDDELNALHVVDGEERPASVEVNTGGEREPENTAGWRNNRFISE